MILNIHSKNPNLLDLLNKNPNTDFGLYFMPLRNGQVAGIAVDEHNYQVVFQDSKYSYLPEESNQIDFQSYCNPLAVLHLSNELFRQILTEKEKYFSEEIKWLKKLKSDIDVFPCSIEIPTFYIDSSWYRNGTFLLSRYFKGIEVQHTVGKNFHLKITANSVFEAFNLLNLTALLVHLTNQSGIYTFIDDSFAAKYVRILTNMENVPYFVFYLFIKRAMRSENQFKQLKPIFENYLAGQGLQADLTFNDTHFDRIKFIIDRLDLTTAVVDFGCGEFKYFKRISRKNFTAPYFAIDKDDDVAEHAEKLMANPENGNLFFYKSLAEVHYKEKVNIILSEVIEHNPLDEAKKLVCNLLKLNFDNMYLTTPNREFNVYYQMNDEAMRHDDHDFELSGEEFKTFINDCLQETQNISVTYFGTGDIINGVQPTQGVIFSKT
ncbi:MAG: hypothetical protein KF900_07535 [Bacteroidetes bacterium]|nr:hypothetical protein [Bacteroidota bacterium]